MEESADSHKSVICRQQRRVLTIVDGYPFYLQLQMLQKAVDLSALSDFCQKQGTQVTQPIYCIGKHSANEKFIQAVRFSGFRVITKECRMHPLECSRCRQNLGSCPNCWASLERGKADFDADIAGEICRFAYQNCINYLLLFAMDGDFSRILQVVKQEINVQVELVAISPSFSGLHGHCRTSQTLLTVADQFTPLEQVVGQFSRQVV